MGFFKKPWKAFKGFVNDPVGRVSKDVFGVAKRETLCDNQLAYDVAACSSYEVRGAVGGCLIEAQRDYSKCKFPEIKGWKPQ